MLRDLTRKFHTFLALLLVACLLLTAAPGGTFALLITRTPSILNTFVSSLESTGDLVLRKEVTHPYGDGYTLPDDLSFDFVLSLGPDFAGKTLSTSQGDMTADGKGDLTVTLTPNASLRIFDIPQGTSVTVTETDSGAFAPDGGPERTLVIGPGINSVTYTNRYTPAPAEASGLAVEGVKVLEGRHWQPGDSFTFLLEYKAPGADQSWQTAGTATVTYDPGDPDFNCFSFTSLVQSITYDTLGVYSFRVTEEQGTIGGITYDPAVSYFDVTVGDADMDGALEIRTVDGYQNAAASSVDSGFRVDLTVNNRYAPAGTATALIKISKQMVSLSGQEKSPAGYTFQLYDLEGNLIATSPATSAAGETSIELVFDAAQAGQTFQYILKETNAGQTLDGVIHDSREYPISVTVVDNLDGTVSARICAEGTEAASNVCALTFVNTYDPEDTAVTISGLKELTGRDQKPGEFSFQLFAADGTEPLDVAVNGADGSFAFDTISFDRVGIYRYVVKEDDSAKLGGITYDKSEYYVTVTVTDENGALTATTAITDSTGTPTRLIFRNSYTAAPVEVTFSGIKALSGMELTANAFQFLLYETGEDFEVNTAPLSSAGNDGEGSFVFHAITYTQPGTYYYVIVEDASPALEGMTYDDTVYQVKVTVLDDSQGALTATVTVTADGREADGIFFVNRYTAPEPSDPTDPSQPTTPEVPPTGDRTSMGLPLALLGISFAALVILLFGKNKRR